MRCIHLKGDKHIHKRQTNLLVREVVTQGLRPQSSAKRTLVVSLKGLGAKTK
jgi:hypothetical protein